MNNKLIKYLTLTIAFIAVIWASYYQSSLTNGSNKFETTEARQQKVFGEMKRNLIGDHCPVLSEPVNQFLAVMMKYGKLAEQDETISQDTLEKLESKDVEILVQSEAFRVLEVQNNNNDECGARTLLFLSIVYDLLKDKEKTIEIHKKMVNMANEKNDLAILNVCTRDRLSTRKEKAFFCEMAFSNKTNSVFIEERDLIGAQLLEVYSELQKPVELANICPQLTGYAADSCVTRMGWLSDSLYKVKRYDEANYLNQKLASHWEDVYFDRSITDEKIKEHAFYSLRQSYEKLHDKDRLYKLCADMYGEERNGCSRSLYVVGSFFLKEKNFEAARSIFTHIADDDEYGLAAWELADMYLYGKGVVKDYGQAIKYYEIVLKRDQFRSDRSFVYNNIGASYYYLFNYTKAFNNFYNAAILGHVKAQLNLAEMYVSGEGTFQDLKQAYAWDSVAVVQGLENANDQARAIRLKNYLIRLLIMSPNDFDEAKAIERQYYKDYVQHDTNSTMTQN